MGGPPPKLRHCFYRKISFRPLSKYAKNFTPCYVEKPKFFSKRSLNPRPPEWNFFEAKKIFEHAIVILGFFRPKLQKHFLKF